MATKVRFPLQSSFQFRDQKGGLFTLESPELHQFLLQLSNRVGGTATDSISDINTTLTDLQNQIDALSAFVIQTAVYTLVDYTTTGSVVVIMKSNKTVYLNANPSNFEAVRIVRQTSDGAVTVDGNGKNINNDTTYKMLADEEARLFVYYSSDDKWYLT